MIVAPLSILGVWEEEFQKFAAFPYALAVLSGSSAKKLDTADMIGTALQVVVVNYESAWRLEKALTAWHPDLIIADEGHKIKTHNIAASKAMHPDGPGGQATGSCSPVRLSPTRPLMCSASINF